MARVSTRIGWGRSSAGFLAVAAFNLLLAAALYRFDYQGLSWMVLGLAALATFFALFHSHRVLETDSDDDPQLKVGDLIDD
jgi:hypothetical protein